MNIKTRGRGPIYMRGKGDDINHCDRLNHEMYALKCTDSEFPKGGMWISSKCGRVESLPANGRPATWTCKACSTPPCTTAMTLPPVMGVSAGCGLIQVEINHLRIVHCG